MSGKLPISLVVITKNEERNLARCLQAADFCNELLVVDSGSTDNTLAIAAEHGARILHRDWTGYRDQKNYGSDAAREPWVLCIDADEVASGELRADIIQRFQREPAEEAFEINRHALYAGRPINHSGWYPQWRLFLYRKGKAVWSGEEPHTVPHFQGTRSARLRGDLYHYTYSDIRQHIQKNLTAARDSAAAMHRRGRKTRWPDLLLRPFWAGFRTYFLQLGFLDGFYGFVIAAANGYYTFTKYAMLRELTMIADRQVQRETREHAGSAR